MGIKKFRHQVFQPFPSSTTNITAILIWFLVKKKKEYNTQNWKTKFWISQQSLEKLLFSTQFISPQKASNKSESKQPGLPEGRAVVSYLRRPSATEARKIGAHFNTRSTSEPAANPKAARSGTMAGAAENLSPLVAGTVISQCTSRFLDSG